MANYPVFSVFTDTYFRLLNLTNQENEVEMENVVAEVNQEVVHAAQDPFVQRFKKWLTHFMVVVLASYMLLSSLLFSFIGLGLLYSFFNVSLTTFHSLPVYGLVVGVIIAIIGTMLRLYYGSRDIGEPVTKRNIAARVFLRIVIVIVLYHIITEFIKLGKAHPSGFLLRLILWLSGVYGIFLADIGLGLYGGLETSFPETSIVVFLGFAITLYETSSTLQKVTMGFMVLTMVMGSMIYGYQTFQNSLIPLPNELNRRLLALEEGLAQRAPVQIAPVQGAPVQGDPVQGDPAVQLHGAGV